MMARQHIDRRDLLVKTTSLISLGMVLGSTTATSTSPTTAASFLPPASAATLPPPSPSFIPPSSTTPPTSNPTPSTTFFLNDFLSGLVGGAASRASKELLLHPLDTIKARLQYAKGDIPPAELFKHLYDGVWPALLVGTPAGAAFFATKDVLKGLAKSTFGSEYRELTTIVAVFVANFPYWTIRNPAEVIKTQQQTGLVNGTLAGVTNSIKEEGITGLYRGFGSNVAYAFPTDAIKFVVYEALQKSFARKLNPLESSLCGSAASSVAQLLSTPLDVIRTRIMTETEEEREGRGARGGGGGGGENSSGSVVETAKIIIQEEGVGKLFSGLTPRLTRAVLSGAIQFGSYELTKGAFLQGFGGGGKK